MTECAKCYNKAYDCDGRCERDPLDQEFVEGYLDGLQPDSPEPSGNRHPAYLHSFRVARAEREGKPIPAAVSRKAAEAIRAGGAA